MAVAVDVRGLEKRFGAHVALRPLTLRMDEGEIFGFLGSNGAGKTTTIRMLTTLVRPSGGTALVCGKDVVREPHEVRRRIGVVSDRIHLYPDLTVRQNLVFFGRLHGIEGARLEDRVRTALARVDLLDRREHRVGSLSFGLRKRAEIASALLHEPRVLFMDEATTGIDPQNSLRIRQLAQELAREGMCILWTTHLMEEPQRLCRRVAIMSRGEVKAVGNPYDLARRIEREKTVEIRTDARATPEQVALLAGVLGRQGLAVAADAEAGVVKAVVDRDHDVRRVLAMAREFGYVHAVNTLEPSLEDVFIHYTSEAALAGA